MALANRPQTLEIYPGPGFRIRKTISRPPKSLIDRFKDFDTTMISDCMNRFYAISPQIQLLTDTPGTICGPACTVKVFPSDNLMVHKAIDIAQMGDVIVVDSSGTESNAMLGEFSANKAKYSGIEGFVIDGRVRDIEGIRKIQLPVFAKGITSIGPLHRGPGEVNFPIQCGGVVVNPGDIIVGDANGVVVVPYEMAVMLLDRLNGRSASELEYRVAVLRGEFSNDWVDSILQTGGCQEIE